MAYWLVKTEPGEYSWSDLVRDRRTRWSGVRNATALRHLGAMRPGDLVAVYHTGEEKRAVGIAAVAAAPYADPDANDARLLVCDLEAREPLAAPVTLAVLKADPEFADSPLARQPRLSVVPLDDGQWRRLLALARGGQAT